MDLNKKLKKIKIDIIIHCGTHYVKNHNVSDINKLTLANIEFGVILLENLKSMGVKKFINFSTVWQNYNGKQDIAYNLYSAFKLSYSKILDYYIGKFSFIRFYNLFISDTYGENDNRSKIINLIKPDLVMHLAAESHVDRSINSPWEFIESNVIGTYNLLEASRSYFNKLNGGKKSNFRFHHISTDEVFGSLSDIGTFSEKTPYDPRSPYSASKASSDHLVRAWHHTYNFPIIITNCSNNFGPWQYPEKLIPLTISKAINLQTIPIYGDGSNVRDWLFVDDHVDALIISATKGEIGETYCIGGFGERTNLQVVKKICDILDVFCPQNIKYSELMSFVKDRPGHDKRYSINSEKIQSKLNWYPKYSFDEALEKTIKWYLENKEFLK